MSESAYDRFSSDSGAPEPDNQILRPVGRAWWRSAARFWGMMIGFCFVVMTLIGVYGGAFSAVTWLTDLAWVITLSVTPLVLVGLMYLLIEGAAALLVRGPASFGSVSRAQVVTEASIDEVNAAIQTIVRSLGVLMPGPDETSIVVSPVWPGWLSGWWQLHVDVRASADHPGKTVVTLVSTPNRSSSVGSMGVPQRVINKIVAAVPMSARTTSLPELGQYLSADARLPGFTQPRSFFQPPIGEAMPVQDEHREPPDER